MASVCDSGGRLGNRPYGFILYTYISMDFTAIIQMLINALRPGALYALIGLGFVIVYLATGSINFAQGEFIALGGLTCAWLIAAGIPMLAAIALTLVLGIALGWLMDHALIRPLSRGSGGSLTRMVTLTIGASVLFRQIGFHLFGPNERPMPTLFRQQVIVLGELRIETQALVLVVVSVAVILLFLVFYYRSRFGRGMRAIEQSREGAVLVGVRPERIINRSFVMAAFIGVLCGVLATPLIQMAYNSGSQLGVKGFTVAILGGLTNPLGVLVGGLLLGLVETGVATFINPLYKDAIALTVLIVMLIVRPTGLLGSREKAKL